MAAFTDLESTMESNDIRTDALPFARRDRSYWQTQFESWQLSGLSKAAFCRQEAVPIKSFYYWCRAFESKSPALEPDGVVQTIARFVPLTARSEPSAAMTMQIADVTLNCDQPVSADQLRIWLQAIRSTL
jgi:hypothetical protein